MNIVSLNYILFVIVFLSLYYSVPKKTQWQIILIANTVFYGFTGLGNLTFIISSSLITYITASIVSNLNEALKKNKLEKSKEDYKKIKVIFLSKKRFILISMLILNVGLLVYLKYWRVLFSSKSLFLPIGISYYTLQTISYFMDVYNEKIQHEKSFFRYFAYVSFFPQLIMGPINRYGDTGKQINSCHNFKFENIKHGVMLILYGAMKKIIIADMLVGRISDIMDPNLTNIPGFVILFGILMYSVYQYADFSGGIDMVLGVAELFDIKMMQNFKQPYFSTSLANFWQRWHISLGAWMRDYVFYPLALTKFFQKISKFFSVHAGKHVGRVIGACIANIVVFVLVGIWHGPELHFLIWGLYNGIIIALSDLCSPIFKNLTRILKINENSKGFYIFRIIRTFIIVNIGWYFDRITDVRKSFIYLKNTFLNFGNPLNVNRDYLNTLFGHISNFQSQIVLVIIGTCLVLFNDLYKNNRLSLYSSIQKKNIFIRWSTYYLLLILIIIGLSFTQGDVGFMYAQY